MNYLSDSILAEARAAYNWIMSDTGVLLWRTASALDDYGQPVAGWTASAPTSCGLDARASREVMPGTNVPVYDARLRLVLGTTVGSPDRVRITHRYGAALDTPIVYEVIGEPMRGPLGLVLNLRSVTDGSGEAGSGS